MPPPNNNAKWKAMKEPSLLLSIDSPMVMWHTDLATIFGEGLAGGGGDTGAPLGLEGPGPTAETAFYLAVCPRGDHFAEWMPDGGVWMSPESENYVTALSEAQGHEHLEAYVAMRLGNYMIGPVKQSV